MKSIVFSEATAADADAIAALQTAVAENLTARHGRGHWSSATTAKGVLFSMTRAKVYVAKKRGRIVATFALSTRKPWAIDKSYFASSVRPLYLTAMAVAPNTQKHGFGSLCIREAIERARAWPADAIRLDAYDATGSAGGFYEKCGFREVGRVVYRKTPLIYFEMLLEVAPTLR